MNTLVILLAVAAAAHTADIRGVQFVGMPYTRLHLGETRAKLSLERLATTGANWISLPITVFQDFKNSTFSYIGVHPFITETGVNEAPRDPDIVSILQEAKERNLKVMIQFQALTNAPYWPDSREIGDYWAPWNALRWFERYTEHVLHYLKVFEQVGGVDMISLGHNFLVLSQYEYHWRDLANRLRNETTVPLTYSVAFGDEDRQSGFWEHLDYVGVFPRFRSRNKVDLAREIEEFVRVLRYMNKLWKKPVLVTRVASCSRSSDTVSQSELFESVSEAVKGLDFVKGIFFGDWPADILYGYGKSKTDPSYSILHKPAEETVRKIFGGSEREIEIPEKPEGYRPYNLNCDCFASA